MGVDIAQISRFEPRVTDAAFLARFFTEGERAYLALRGAAAAQSLAGLFAAKEAALKALGTGLAGMRLLDIEVTHDSGGAPELFFSGTAAVRAEAMRVENTFLSISHDGGVAVAVVVLEGT